MKARLGLAILVSVTLAIPAYAQPELVEVIVVLEPADTAVAESAAEIARTHNGQVGFVYEHAIEGMTLSLPETSLAGLARNPRVAYFEPLQEVTIAAQPIPEGIDRIDGDLNMPAGSYAGVDIAVIDTGIYIGTNGDGSSRSHLDLNLRYVTDCTGASFYPLFGGCSGSGNLQDENGHGTHVAGIAAALNNSIGSLGVAYGATLWSVKVLGANGTGTTGNLLAGIDFVTANADQIEVANMSLTFAGSSQAIDDAIATATNAGVTFVVAAGNDSADAAGYSPASNDDAITVSALADFDGLPGGLGSPTCRADQDDTLADFSNFGADVQLAAPGVCIYSTHLDDGYATYSGTSMAAPFVAGAVARYIHDNGLDPDSRSDVESIKASVMNGATPQSSTCGFTGDVDGYPEPLLFLNGPGFGGDGTCGESIDPGTTNQSPVADAGIDQTVTDSDDSGSELVILDGSGSTDPDGVIASYEWYEGTNVIATGVGATVDLAVGVHDITLIVTDDDGATASDDVVITVESAPTTDVDIHVGDLDYESFKLQKGTWAAGVAISVHDGAESGVAGAEVTGSFHQNGLLVVTTSCTTLVGSGTCFVESGVFPGKDGKATFVVESVDIDGFAYDPSANHDPDGDSDGSVIEISKGG